MQFGILSTNKTAENYVYYKTFQSETQETEKSEEFVNSQRKFNQQAEQIKKLNKSWELNNPGTTKKIPLKTSIKFKKPLALDPLNNKYLQTRRDMLSSERIKDHQEIITKEETNSNVVEINYQYKGRQSRRITNNSNRLNKIELKKSSGEQTSNLPSFGSKFGNVSQKKGNLDKFRSLRQKSVKIPPIIRDTPSFANLNVIAEEGTKEIPKASSNMSFSPKDLSRNISFSANRPSLLKRESINEKDLISSKEKAANIFNFADNQEQDESGKSNNPDVDGTDNVNEQKKLSIDEYIDPMTSPSKKKVNPQVVGISIKPTTEKDLHTDRLEVKEATEDKEENEEVEPDEEVDDEAASKNLHMISMTLTPEVSKTIKSKLKTNISNKMVVQKEKLKHFREQILGQKFNEDKEMDAFKVMRLYYLVTKAKNKFKRLLGRAKERLRNAFKNKFLVYMSPPIKLESNENNKTFLLSRNIEIYKPSKTLSNFDLI